MRTLQWRVKVAIAVLACGSAACGSATAGVSAVDVASSSSTTTAPSHSRSMNVSPTSGAVGTLISVSGAGCTKPGTATTNIHVLASLVDKSTQTGSVDAEIPVHGDGSWSGTLTVPSTADAANDHVVNAVCLLDGDEAILEYAAVPFTVTATATPSSLPRTG